MDHWERLAKSPTLVWYLKSKIGIRGSIRVTLLSDGVGSYVLDVSGDDDARRVVVRISKARIGEDSGELAKAAKYQKLVRARGIPVPRVLGASFDGSVLGHCFFVEEAIDGTTLLEHALTTGSADRGLSLAAGITANLQLRIHNLSLGKSSGGRHCSIDSDVAAERFSARTSRTNASTLTSAMLRSVPLGGDPLAVVCHCDLHLSNILISSGPRRSAVVVDWEKCTITDRHRDIAETVIITLCGHSGMPEIDGVQGLLLRVEFLKRYLTIYDHLYPLRGDRLCRAIFDAAICRIAEIAAAGVGDQEELSYLHSLADVGSTATSTASWSELFSRLCRGRTVGGNGEQSPRS